MTPSTIVLAGFLPGGGELWIILALALLFFGAAKLPGIARSLGRSVNEFKSGLREGASESSPASGTAPSEKAPSAPPPPLDSKAENN